MNEQTDPPSSWVVRFDAEQIEFQNFSAAVTYADSLALRRTLVKHIDPVQQLIDLAEDRRKMNYQFDYQVNRRPDS
jgi:hypothetical protein